MKNQFCRSCQSDALQLVVDFGPQPLAGAYPEIPESRRAARRYPLDLSQCARCGLLQVTNLPPIEEVFHADYRYSSSTVPDLVRHFDGYADYLVSRLPAKARILEFGCNDGVLLERLRERGFEVAGVDASDNVAEIARRKGLDVLTGFLTRDFVDEQGLAGAFDAVTCSNVFAHIDDIRGAAAAVRRLLRPQGHFFIEVHDGDVLAREGQFDTVYHEHLTYFTEATLRSFAAREGFAFVECPRTPMHGGALRFACRFAPDDEKPEPAPPALVDGELFAHMIQRCRADVVRLNEAHGPLYGYGAAGRSQMFVNMIGEGERFAAVYDDSPFRQDRFIIGTDIPIRPYAGERGACCVVLAWNYAPTIAAKVRDRFDKIVTLLPDYREWPAGRADDMDKGLG